MTAPATSPQLPQEEVTGNDSQEAMARGKRSVDEPEIATEYSQATGRGRRLLLDSGIIMAVFLVATFLTYLVCGFPPLAVVSAPSGMAPFAVVY